MCRTSVTDRSVTDVRHIYVLRKQSNKARPDLSTIDLTYVALQLASTPGCPLEEGRPGIDCLRMREVFRILSSKFDRKLNFP